MWYVMNVTTGMVMKIVVSGTSDMSVIGVISVVIGRIVMFYIRTTRG